MLSFALLFYLLAFCRAIIVLVFCISSASKAGHMAQFQRAIREFHILPPNFADLAAIFFLCAEFAVVVLLIIGKTLFLGFILALFLLLLFSVVLISALTRRMQTSCNCFGPTTRQISSIDIWRNGCFALCALSGIVLFSFLKGIQGSLNLIEWLPIVLGASAFVVIWLQLHEIVQLFHQ